MVGEVSGMAGGHLAEADLARSVLCSEYSLPAWTEATVPEGGPPRKVRQAAEKQAVGALGAPLHVATASTPESRGYKPRRKKGKPLDKGPV